MSTNRYVPEHATAKVFNNLTLFETAEKDIVETCNRLWNVHNLRLKTITAVDDLKVDGTLKLIYVFGATEDGSFVAPYIQVKDRMEFPSLAHSIHAASVFERKIYSLFGLTPTDHPNLRPMILHGNWPEGCYPLRKAFDGRSRPEWSKGHYPFFTVEGEGVYEIPVGPVHAGIIEPGHFRFTVAGEEVLFLDPMLGYVHKGTEKLFESLPLEKKLMLSERVSGDSSFSHSLAFCQAVETLTGIDVPGRARYLRVIFAELERLANHFNDIGFILMDTGYSFGGAQGARLRETVMQWNERLTGHRFLRKVNTIGGVTEDIDSHTQVGLSNYLKDLERDFSEVVSIACSSHSVFNRLKGTGILDRRVAEDHGVVGVAARASGIAADARIDHPYAAYGNIPFEIAVETAGDVHARFMVRIKEVASSIRIIGTALERLAPENGPSAAINDPEKQLQLNSYAVGTVEGWRGDITYIVATDSKGSISRVDVRDPSLVNWTAVPHAVKGNIVPDFPLINKSFNLSYSGNDL